MKIEAGCKAVIVNSLAGHNGKTVTVIKHLPRVIYVKNKYGDAWEVDIELIGTNGESDRVIGEAQLKRIDDDSRQITSWDAIAHFYKPPLREKTVAKA